jgi:hypothetical protein
MNSLGGYKEQARKELLREHNEFTRSYKELLCSGKNDVFKDWYMCSGRNDMCSKER